MKAVILIGGPQKGTRFRPLSLEIPKPLFPVAGQPMIEHHIEACIKVPEMQEIILIGYFNDCEPLRRFVQHAQKKFRVPIRYLQEYESLGTGGGLYHFRDQILKGGLDEFFVMNCDVCCDFPLVEMIEFRRNHAPDAVITMLGTEANSKQAINYGCIVEDSETHEVSHYVEKPETFVSNVINTGIYLLSFKVFDFMKNVFEENYASGLEDPGSQKDTIRLEQDVLAPLSGTGQVFVYKTNRFWCQIKTASSTIYANRLYLAKSQRDSPDLLESPSEKNIIGDVRIHETAEVDPTAKLGPNVYIGPGVRVNAGARVRESIILDGAILDEHCCVLHSIIGWNSRVGQWARVEGFPCDPNPNDPLARLASDSMFNEDGRLNPAITILAKDVTVSREIIVLNSIVLPHKDLSFSYKNQIIL